MAEVCDWSTEGRGGANQQITIYFSQMHVYSLDGVIYKDYHDYLLVATAECFVLGIKWQSFNLTRCMY